MDLNKLGIKSQAQYDAVQSCIQTLELILKAILTGDKTQESESIKALEIAFNATRKATELTEKLQAVPEAATSKEAEKFKSPPLQLKEKEVLVELLEKLEKLESVSQIEQWYVSTVKEREKVVTQEYRNKLIDTIRDRIRLLRQRT